MSRADGSRPVAIAAPTRPVPLRPMSLADLLDGAFRLLKLHGPMLLGYALVIVGPLQLASIYLQREFISGGGGVWRTLTRPAGTGFGDTAGTLPQGAQLAITIAQLVVIVPLLAGAVAAIAGRAALGEQVDNASILRTTVRRAPAVLVTALLVHVLEFGLVLAGVGAIALGAPGLGAFLIGIGVLVAFLVMPLFVVAVPVLVNERGGPFVAVRRSIRLLKPRYGATLGAAVVSALMAGFLGLAVAGLPGAVSLLMGRYGWIAVGAGSVLSSLVSLPFVTLVATLIYLDARIRQEGLDLELMTREFLDAR